MPILSRLTQLRHLALVAAFWGLMGASRLMASGEGADPHASAGIPNREGFDFSAWEGIPIQEGGLEKSLYTFAMEFVRENAGKARYGGRHPIENLFSMAFEPEKWAHEPIIKIQLPELKKIFGVQKHERITPMLVEEKRETWLPFVKESKEGNKEMARIFHQIDEIFGGRKGEQSTPPLADRLKIVPTVNFRGDKDLWRDVDELALRTKDKNPQEVALIAGFTASRESFIRNDAAAFNKGSIETIQALQSLGVPKFKPDWKFGLDRWSSKIGVFTLAGWTYLLAAVLFLISYLAGEKILSIAATSTLGLGAGLNVAALVIRGILAGRTPVANLFESGVFIICSITVFSLIISLYYRTRVVGLAGSTLGAFFMGIANNIPLQYGRKILPLIDALQSYWLHIHVTSMLMSYAFFAIAFFVACAYMARLLLAGRGGAGTTLDAATDPTLLYLDSLNFRIITIGMPILTGGVILGAVWASEAWGRPWAFDPKETAAAITWMIYAFYLHARLFLGWRGTRGVLLSIVGFGAVVFTYLGVSFFLPGLHSYVSDGEFTFGDLMKKIIPGI